ncbi:hypothetical protein HDU76_005564 [Blyttiomyces sp. JEL0837]|nr:hypothetical protein HDU76_005564 [Blyttiomyces sp. JEL0837]
MQVAILEKRWLTANDPADEAVSPNVANDQTSAPAAVAVSWKETVVSPFRNFPTELETKYREEYYHSIRVVVFFLSFLAMVLVFGEYTHSGAEISPSVEPKMPIYHAIVIVFTCFYAVFALCCKFYFFRQMLEFVPLVVAMTSTFVFGFDRFAAFDDPPPHTITVPVMKVLISFFYCGACGIRFRISVMGNAILVLLNAVSFSELSFPVQLLVGLPLWFTACISMLIAYNNEKSERAMWVILLIATIPLIEVSRFKRYQILLEEIDSLKAARLREEQVLQLSLSPQVITALRDADGDFNSLTGNTPDASVAFVEFINLDDFTKSLEDVSTSSGESLLTYMVQKVQLLNTLLDIINGIITKGGGEFIKNIGDKILLCCGTNGEDDNALQCLKILRQIFNEVPLSNNSKFQELKLRAGVHSGPITYGVIGDMAFTFDIFGDTVNLASRMLSLSLLETIFMTNDVLRRLPPAFVEEMRIVDLGYLRVKGKGEVQTWKMLATGIKSTETHTEVKLIRRKSQKKQHSSRLTPSHFRDEFMRMKDRAKDVFREQLENEELTISPHGSSRQSETQMLPSYNNLNPPKCTSRDDQSRKNSIRPPPFSRKVNPETETEKNLSSYHRNSSLVNAMSRLIDEIMENGSQGIDNEANIISNQGPFATQPFFPNLTSKGQKDMVVLWRLEFISPVLERLYKHKRQAKDQENMARSLLWLHCFVLLDFAITFAAVYGWNLTVPLNSSVGVIAFCAILVGSSLIAYMYLLWHQYNERRNENCGQGSKMLGTLASLAKIYRQPKPLEVPIAIFCSIVCTVAISVLTPALKQLFLSLSVRVNTLFLYRTHAPAIAHWSTNGRFASDAFDTCDRPSFESNIFRNNLLQSTDSGTINTGVIDHMEEYWKRKKFLFEYSGFLAQELCKAEKERSLLVLKHTMSPRISDLLATNASTGIVQYSPEGAVIAFDIVGFTSLSSNMFADDVVFMICTIGDAYVAVAGLPEALPMAGKSAARVALQILAVMADFNPRLLLLSESQDANAAQNIPDKINARIGLHVGPVCGALVGGKTKVKYDLVGLSSETAVNLEQTSSVGNVHVFEETLHVLEHEFGCGDGREIDDMLRAKEDICMRWEKYEIRVKVGDGLVNHGQQKRTYQISLKNSSFG